MDSSGVELRGIKSNMNMLDKWINEFPKKKNKGVDTDEQKESENNQ